jgi:beta-phosphoglucomutase-like phosphatase (HAD superfamily)
MNMPPQSRFDLVEDLKRRAEAVDQACKRSNDMERAFLEKKVLNREANEALEDFGRKRGQFGEYLLQRSDEIIAALSEKQALLPGVEALVKDWELHPRQIDSRWASTAIRSALEALTK